MTALSLFLKLAKVIPGGIESEYDHPNDNCILSTRIAIEVARNFGIHAYPMAVRVIAMNRAFAKHVEEGDIDVKKWQEIDGSWSVGIGCGFKPGQTRLNRWDGHLIAAAPGCFGDFSIAQAERRERGIVTGPALVGPLIEGDRRWTAIDEVYGTVIQYERTNDGSYRTAPDWRDEARRKRIAGPIIRALRSVADVQQQV